MPVILTQPGDGSVGWGSLVNTNFVDTYTKIVGQWLPFTPVINGFVSNPTKGATRTEKCFYRRTNESMEIMFGYQQTSAGTAGSGGYQFVLPGGFAVDTTKIFTGGLGSGSDTPSALGSGYVVSIGVSPSIYQVVVAAINPTSLVLRSSSPSDWVGSTFAQFSLANVMITFTATVPIAGW